MFSCIGSFGATGRAGRFWLVLIALSEAALLTLGLACSSLQVRPAEPGELEQDPPPSPSPPSPTAIAAARQELLAQLSAIAGTTDGTFGVAIVELDTGDIFGINQDQWFPAASTVKLQLLALLYREIEVGRIGRHTLLAFTESDYEEGTGSIQNSELGGYWTVSELAVKMIKESDNVAKNMLIRLLGSAAVSDFNLSQGVITDGDNNYTTPRSMAVLLELIYREKLVRKEQTAEMLELMTGSDNENRLPRYLSSMRVAHKIGTVDSSVSDVGIVFLPGAPFVLSIYSDGTTDLDEAEATIAALAAQVCDYEARRAGPQP